MASRSATPSSDRGELDNVCVLWVSARRLILWPQAHSLADGPCHTYYTGLRARTAHRWGKSKSTPPLVTIALSIDQSIISARDWSCHTLLRLALRSALSGASQVLPNGYGSGPDLTAAGCQSWRLASLKPGKSQIGRGNFFFCGKLARRLAVPKFPGPQKVSDRQALHDPIISVLIRYGESVPASQGRRSLQPACTFGGGVLTSRRSPFFIRSLICKPRSPEEILFGGGLDH